MYHTIALYNETDDVYDRPRGGRPRSVPFLKRVNAVLVRVFRNSLHKQKILTKELNVSERSICCVLRKDLLLGNFRRCTINLLNTKLREIRKMRTKNLVKKYKKQDFKTILFTDEKCYEAPT